MSKLSPYFLPSLKVIVFDNNKKDAASTETNYLLSGMEKLKTEPSPFFDVNQSFPPFFCTKS